MQSKAPLVSCKVFQSHISTLLVSMFAPSPQSRLLDGCGRIRRFKFLVYLQLSPVAGFAEI
ncbi:hypothetical protein RchiOBHm_Chr4g0390211 [Rosa chinensis]|uniref:Uncharacterized protein n=1 Tax=Rosa chinensis TaxID=74649 RepID=A0A2P6QQA0_ROSCH|nr:hypothetical protein RchiOBHm_Chr4g0390211 [Rosa chinensis]